VLETINNGVHEIKQAYSKPAGVTILTPTDKTSGR
jgi:hypothetical protein